MEDLITMPKKTPETRELHKILLPLTIASYTFYYDCNYFGGHCLVRMNVFRAVQQVFMHKKEIILS